MFTDIFGRPLKIGQQVCFTILNKQGTLVKRLGVIDDINEQYLTVTTFWVHPNGSLNFSEYPRIVHNRGNSQIIVIEKAGA